jgi:Ni,Fe-hydrogenase III large subunit
MSEADFAAIYNATAISQEGVPCVDIDRFRSAVLERVERGDRVVSFFGTQGRSGGMELIAVLGSDDEGLLRVTRAALTRNVYHALTPSCAQVHLFERETAESWGVVPDGHPWLKPLRFHPSRRPGHDAWHRDPDDITVGVMDFYRVDGNEIHEVAVGPVHAGVIEPGHFRFQCHGETVFHLEISLGYQHRGIELSLVGGPGKRTIHYMETLAGDTSVGHATAYCQGVEALAACRASPRAAALRGIALELERLANHTGGLGALAGDVGFLPTAAHCGRLRGEFLNLTATICGSRFGRGLVRPGGVGFDIDSPRISDMLGRLERAYQDVAQSANLLWTTPSVQARFEDTGRVPTEVALELGLVGVAARASGLERDVREHFPTGIYRMTQIPTAVSHSGSVFARAYVRWLEIQRSVEFLRDQLRSMPAGPIRVSVPALRPGQLSVSLVEGWRGEICHVAMTDDAGRFASYKVVDPSFHNWAGLAMALRNEQISDFPLCNKSFDLSYCGHDL